ncbi:unnamed protein product, partial [Prunus brigantina]
SQISVRKRGFLFTTLSLLSPLSLSLSLATRNGGSISFLSATELLIRFLPQNLFFSFVFSQKPIVKVYSLCLAESVRRFVNSCYGAIEARKGNPPILPAVMTPGGPLDLSSVLFRNRIIFIGQPVNSLVAQRVISQLVTLATVDENADILVYLNCPGGSTYSVLAIYDCMSWIKPKVGTVCFGVAASQGALLLAGGEKGMRYAMPNARIMIHQPQSGCGGHVEDVRRQVNEAVQTRQKVDNMYVAFTGQSLEKVQQYTERDRFLSVSEEKCLVPLSQLFRASFELEGKEKGEQEILAEKGENRRKVW